MPDRRGPRAAAGASGGSCRHPQHQRHAATEDRDGPGRALCDCGFVAALGRADLLRADRGDDLPRDRRQAEVGGPAAPAPGSQRAGEPQLGGADRSLRHGLAAALVGRASGTGQSPGGGCRASTSDRGTSTAVSAVPRGVAARSGRAGYRARCTAAAALASQLTRPPPRGPPGSWGMKVRIETMPVDGSPYRSLKVMLSLNQGSFAVSPPSVE